MGSRWSFAGIGFSTNLCSKVPLDWSNSGDSIPMVFKCQGINSHRIWTTTMLGLLTFLEVAIMTQNQLKQVRLNTWNTLTRQILRDN